MTNETSRHRIDTHHHFWPPEYIRETEAVAPNPAVAKSWTVERSLADMDGAGVQGAVLSITTPGIWLGDNPQAARLSRLCNDYAARLVQDHPDRFGQFAALPLPDTDASLREIEYALDTLKADGIGLFTSYGDRWIGDPAFDAVFAELNRRKAIVYFHPIAPDCCRELVPGVSDAVIEYGTDTTRAIARWLFSGSAARYPDLTMIFSHGGGTMPFLVERLTRVGDGRPAVLPNGTLYELRRFYYDVAQTAHFYALAALTRLIPTSQILFGTDYPYRLCGEYVKFLAEYPFTEAEARAIDCDNALRLLPRFRKVASATA